MRCNSLQLLILLALVSFFTACEKAPNKGGGAIKGSCKISAVTGYYLSPISISYDSAGRIDTMAASGMSRTYAYENGGNKVTITGIKNNSFDRRIVLKYNKDSKLLDTAMITLKDGTQETRIYTYQSNATVKEKIYSGNDSNTITYSWTGGNMTSAHSTRGINAFTNVKYYADMAFQEGDFNYMNALIDNGYVPVGKTANLVQCNYSGNINYKFNSNGYIKQVSSVNEGYPTVNYTYEYTCK